MEFDLNCTPAQEEDIHQDDINMEEEEDGIDPGHDAVGVEQVVEQGVTKRKTLSDQEKYAAYVALHRLCMSRGGKFKRNDKKDVAQFFKVDVRSIKRVWQKAMKQIADGLEDNAKPHILPTDPEFLEVVSRTGMDVKIIQQPSNSPDLNALDLGFFNSLQSVTDCLSPKTLQDLINGVLEEFEDYEVYKLNRVFLSLQACMIEILNNADGNEYKIPLVNKERLENLGILPLRLSCPREVCLRSEMRLVEMLEMRLVEMLWE
ncbi:hypothetical protein D1007_55862 [Hordeum vulgare]|nr:hypothetical protein D1007_55862 [Hordeum vulgare]